MMSATKKDIFLVLALACAMRVFSVLHWAAVDVTHGDQSEYMALAQNLRLHGAFSFGEPHSWAASGHLNTAGPFVPTAARAPLYPVLLAALWWRESPPVLEMRLLQIGLGAATALLTYLIAAREFNRRVALLAGIGMAFAPMSCYLTAQILTETLFAFLLTLGTWLWGCQRAFLAGVSLGLAALARPALFPFLILVALVACIRSRQRAFLGRLALGGILVIAPWTVRNYVAFHRIIPIATIGWGAHLLMGTLDLSVGSSGFWQRVVADPTVAQILNATNSETDAEGLMMTAAIQRIRQAPVQWAVRRASQSYSLFIDTGRYAYDLIPLLTLATRVVFVTGSVAFWMVAIAGVVKERKRWRELQYLLAFPVFFVIGQIPMLALLRYSVPLIPPMMVFAAVVVSSAMSRLSPSTPQLRAA